MFNFRLSRAIIAVVLAVSGSVPVLAQAGPSKPMTKEEQAKGIQAAWQEAARVAKTGPASVPLVEQGTITLDNNQAFIPRAEAVKLMESLGNTVGANFIGLLAGTRNSDEWLATVSFVKEGYVKDDDAKNWNADDLLANLKEGTEQNNKFRKERGFPALIIENWIEVPAYDSASHRLVWALSARSEGSPADAPRSINYNTYMLGREGYFTLNMLTNTLGIQNDKVVAQKLLASLEFVQGRRYEDFDSSSDKVAAYGLAALVGGAVLKKAGFLAVILAFLLKFWKIAALAAVGVAYGVRKLFSKNNSNA